MSQLTIYRSSAGSGKTYTLTLEYLALVLKNPAHFRHVLAVTFTNKATEEMKSRILAALDKLRNGEDKNLSALLVGRLELTDEEIKTRSQLALTNILHDYSNFAISTIDAFFQRIIRSFSREIGLQAGFALEMEQDKVLQDVIGRLLNEAGQNPQLTQWLIRFAEVSLRDNSKWDFRNTLEQLGKELFKEAFQESKTDIHEGIADSERLLSFIRALKKVKQSFEEELEKRATEGAKAMEESGFTKDDFKGKSKGVANQFDKFLNKNYAITATVRKVLENPEEWVTKSDAQKAQKMEAVLSTLHPCLERCAEFFDNNYAAYVTADIVSEFLYGLGVLGRMAHHLQEYRTEEEVMLISDTNTFLYQLIGNNDAPFIYEKVGNRFHNFLIDEFQDTSKMQWQNLKPLIENSLAQGNKNLIVGDVKQSVYRWRGGDWQLLLEQLQLDFRPDQLNIKPLDQNWRSRREVIRFNNTVFSQAPELVRQMFLNDLPDHLPEQAGQELAQQAESITAAYREAWQQQPAATMPDGYIKMVVTEKPKDGEPDCQYDEIKAAIQQAQDHGYRPGDMAILVRTNQQGKEVAQYLIEQQAEKNNYNFSFISNESLFLDQAISVRVLLHMMRYIYNPADPVALCVAIHEYQTYLKTIDNGEPVSKMFEAAAHAQKQHIILPDVFSKKASDWKRYSLYELVNFLVKHFDLKIHFEERPYIQAFEEAVLNFSRDARSGLGEFLEWWEEEGCKKTLQVPEGQDAIRILTVHKSKGLQFKMVMVPFCDWSLNKGSDILWCAGMDQSPYDQFPLLPLKRTGALKDSFFYKAYFDEQLKASLDTLNLLYVAATRAEDALFIFSPSLAKKGATPRVNKLLYYLLSGRENVPTKYDEEAISLKEGWNAETETFEHGSLPRQSEEAPEEAIKQFELASFETADWRTRLRAKSLSRRFFREQETETARKINYGEMMHEIMAGITTANDVDKVLEQYLFEGMIDQQEQSVIQESLKKLLSHESVVQWFRPGLEVFSEASILAPDNIDKRPDRVVVDNRKATVIDFKFGEPQKKYERQIKDYGRLLQQMGYESIDLYLLYLDENNLSDPKPEKVELI